MLNYWLQNETQYNVTIIILLTGSPKLSHGFSPKSSRVVGPKAATKTHTAASQKTRSIHRRQQSAEGGRTTTRGCSYGSSSALSAAAAIISPMTAAKIATGIMGVSTTVSTLAPSKNLKLFGFESNPTSDAIMLEIGAVGHSLFVMLCLQLFTSVPFATAAGCHFVPYLYKNLHCHLNGKFATGFPISCFGPITTGLALATASSCFFLTNSAAEKAIQAFSLIACLEGLAVIAFPRRWFRKQQEEDEKGSTGTTTETNVHMLHLMGWTWLARGVFLGMQAAGTTPLGALGFTMAVFTASVVSPSLLSSKYDDLGIPKGKFLAYLVFGIGITMALLFAAPFRVLS